MKLFRHLSKMDTSIYSKDIPTKKNDIKDLVCFKPENTCSKIDNENLIHSKMEIIKKMLAIPSGDADSSIRGISSVLKENLESKVSFDFSKLLNFIEEKHQQHKHWGEPVFQIWLEKARGEIDKIETDLITQIKSIS